MGGGAARLSIPEVLNPKTRLAAFQRYCLATESDANTRSLMLGFTTFARDHAGLNLTVSPAAPGGPVYLLTWHSALLEPEDWGGQEGTPERRPRTSEVLVPGDVKFQRFTADGAPVADEWNSARNSVVIDVDGDGVPEQIEQLFWPPGGLVQSEFLVVRPAQVRFEHVSFAVLYNVRPKDRSLQSPWGFQVRPGHPGESCTLELGPLIGLEGVEPAVVFRWDATARAWKGPERKPGDHFVVITSQDPAQGLDSDQVFREAERLARSGVLTLPLQDAPAVPPGATAKPLSPLDEQRVDKDEVSKPYERRSLAGLSNEETLAYMGARRSIREYVRARMLKPADVPNLWTQDPAQAALAYVRANRPPDLEPYFLYHFAGAPDETAPEEGDLTLTDGPSGCFSPGGAYVHHLHCAPEGSFLSLVRTLQPWANVSRLVNHDRAEVRRLDLSQDQARRLLQTLWWMSRVRTRALPSGESLGGPGGSSTSDGEATVQIVAGGDKVTITATRSDDYMVDYVGVSAFSAAYSATSFINLAVRLFQREVPAWLGEAWTSQAPPDREESWPFEGSQPPEDLIAARRRVAELLQLAIKGKVAPDLTGPMVLMVGSDGWQELRPAVERLATQLPPPFAWEKRIEDIEKEISVWEQKFGEAASERASFERRYPGPPSDGQPLTLPANPRPDFQRAPARHEG